MVSPTALVRECLNLFNIIRIRVTFLQRFGLLGYGLVWVLGQLRFVQGLQQNALWVLFELGFRAFLGWRVCVG